ncbi:MAG: site-specific DNA-methyltransferase [Rikenellaceae bacterium]
MAQNKLTKLELTWIGKDEDREALEPRILIEESDYSFGIKEGVDADGMLIHGDNLLALKALEQEYAGKVKCIYIDPPYNTGNAFEHYDDGLEHSIWLGLMRERLELLHKLLAKDGVMFISIDDDECHYLKVLCDEVFGRRNFCGAFIWEKKRKPSFLNSQMGTITEYVLSFAKNRDALSAFAIGKISETETYPLYNAGNARKDIILPPKSVFFPKYKSKSFVPQEYKEETSNVVLKSAFEVIDHWNAADIIIEGEWRYGQSSIIEQIKNGDYYIIKSDKFRPRRVFEKKDVAKKMHNLLSRAHYNMATYEDATSESIKLFGNNPFDYPKPEMLISTLLEATTNKGDLVLDSFLGSGTTAAVAHKMGRKWIGVELGEHAKTHCYPRLKMVCDGTDQGGISKAQNWKGGGGFKFYSLAPSLLNEDKFGNLIINKEYNADMLAAAMAKQEGFNYAPNSERFWKQGYSSEMDYIYTTTQFLTVESLAAIAETMADGESLLVCCTSFQKECRHAFKNITIKKIPQMLLGRCAYDKDSYALNIIDLPQIDKEEDDDFFEEDAAEDNHTHQECNKHEVQGTLFD